MTEQSPLELGETKQEPAYIVLQHANYMERELGRLWLNGDDAKEKAAFIVLAANCHEELVAALEWIDTYLANQPLDQQAKFLITKKVKEALAKVKESTADETRLQQQDLDEETL